jgi:hypothetical protein
VSEQVCASCKFIQTSIKYPQGSEQKELVVKCQNGHAPIWLFSGAECEDYRSKQSETQEQK